MRAKRVMSTNLTGTKTQGNRYHVDELDFRRHGPEVGSVLRVGFGRKRCLGSAN